MSIYKSSFRLLDVFERFLPPEVTHLIGDLEEEYQFDREEYSRFKASRLFWYRLLKTTPFLIYESIIWNFTMIWNYLKVALRNIKKYRTFSLINITGMATSIAVCLLIMLFIYDQKQYDQWHDDKELIYRITSDFKSSGNLSSHQYATSPASLPEILRNDFSGIESATLIRRSVGGEAEANGKSLRVSGLYADEYFPEVFSFQFLNGNVSEALKSPNSIVLSAEMSERFFGTTNPVGESLVLNGQDKFTITGVLDMNVRSHINFDILVSYATQRVDEEYASVFLDNWRNSFYRSYTYVKLRDQQALQTLEEAFPSLIETHYEATPESYMAAFIPQALTRISLGDTMDNQLGRVMPREPVYFLLGFAAIIIFIACFNYVGLTVARSLTRGKEVGVRKALGANNGSVISQFLLEAVIISLLSMIIAMGLLNYFLPEFNNLQMIRYGITRSLSIDFFRDLPIFGMFLTFSVIVGLLAGLFPALHLSSIRTAVVLKGIDSVKGLSKQFIRKSLVVMQFAFSVMFIITAITLSQQFKHFISSDYGYNQESIAMIELGDVPYERIKQELSTNAAFSSVAGSNIIPGLNSRADRTISSDFVDYNTRGNHFAIDENYLETMELDLLAGRNFSAEYSTDQNGPMLITEQTVQVLGFGNPENAIGKLVVFADSLYPVIGVVEDFVSSDVTIEPEAVIMQYMPVYIDMAIVKFAGDDVNAAVSEIEETWTALGGTSDIDLTIFADELKEAYSLLMFQDLIKLMRVFAVFSVIISCLGLFGMAMFNAESRTKEIGIRKALGAENKDILFLLSKEYFWLIVIAIIISLPLINVLNGLMLDNISNRMDFNPWIYFGGIILSVVLAMLTVGSQSMRAATQKAIDSIRTE